MPMLRRGAANGNNEERRPWGAAGHAGPSGDGAAGNGAAVVPQLPAGVPEPPLPPPHHHHSWAAPAVPNTP